VHEDQVVTISKSSVRFFMSHPLKPSVLLTV